MAARLPGCSTLPQIKEPARLYVNSAHASIWVAIVELWAPIITMGRPYRKSRDDQDGPAHFGSAQLRKYRLFLNRWWRLALLSVTATIARSDQIHLDTLLTKPLMEEEEKYTQAIKRINEA